MYLCKCVHWALGIGPMKSLRKKEKEAYGFNLLLLDVEVCSVQLQA